MPKRRIWSPAMGRNDSRLCWWISTARLQPEVNTRISVEGSENGERKDRERSSGPGFRAGNEGTGFLDLLSFSADQSKT